MCLDHLQDGDMLVISGSVPASLSADLHERIMKRVQGKAIRIVVDVAGELLNRGLKHRPFLIKPNHHELGDLFGVRIDTLQDAFPYARQLQTMGAQNVLVSMGASGALLIGEDGREYVCAAVQGEPINTVGAGDSMVAGFLSGYIESDGNLLHALKKGVTAGSASAFSETLTEAAEVSALLAELNEEKRDLLGLTDLFSLCLFALSQRVLQRAADMPLSADDGLRMIQRAAHGFFAGFDPGAEHLIHVVFMQDVHGAEGSCGKVRDRVCGGKGDDDIAAAVSQIASGPGERGRHAPAQPLELARFQRDVRRQHDDDRALFTALPLGLGEICSGMDEVRFLTEIGKHQRAERECLFVQFDDAGGRADPAFHLKTAHASSCADRAQFECFAGILDGLPHILLRDGACADVIEVSVIAFGDHDIDRPAYRADLRVFVQHILDQRLLHRAYAQRVGHGDRAFQRAQLFDLQQACRFGKAVDHMAGCGQLAAEDGAVTWHHHTDAGLDVFAADGGVSDPYAGHIADEISLSCFHAVFCLGYRQCLVCRPSRYPFSFLRSV